MRRNFKQYFEGGTYMADDPSKTPGISAETPLPQSIPLAKIHDLPGVFISKQPDKSYGGLVSSIQSSGVKVPVILRLREDGEYQLVSGYRRRRGSELAKKKDIPAYVYDMTLQQAVDYHRRVQNEPKLPIPGKLIAAAKVAPAPPRSRRLLPPQPAPSPRGHPPWARWRASLTEKPPQQPPRRPPAKVFPRCFHDAP